MALADTARLVTDLVLNDKFSGPAKNATASLNRLQTGGEQVGRGIRQVGTGLTSLGTRAAVVAAGGLTAVVKTAIDFETAFTGVAKTIEATPAQLEELNAGFQKLAQTIPLSVEELAGIGEQAGALGIAKEDILDFTEVVAKIGTTTDVSADQAATALGQLSNVLDLPTEDLDNFGAALVELGNKGASTESQILEITRRFGATGAQAGLSAQEVLAFGAAAANTGLQSELAGGALQRFFIRTQKFVNSNDVNLELMAKTAGLTGDAFIQAFEKDASGAILKFIQGLEKMTGKQRAATLASLEFSNQTGLNQLLSGLAQNSDNLADSLDNSARGWEENLALNVEAEKRYATTAAKLSILKNNVRNAAFEIGRTLIPVLKDVTDELSAFINQPDTQKRIKEFAKDLAQGARDLVGAFKAGEFDPLIENLKGAAQFAKTAFDAFNALPGPIKQVLIAGAVANKVTGGAVGLIAAGGANILKGLIGIGGGLLGRGASPANPLFVTQVGGIPGGGLPGGGTGLGGAVGFLGFIGLVAGAGLALAQFVRTVEDVDAKIGHSLLDRAPPRLSSNVGTPLGQFSAANAGGTPIPVKVTNPGTGADNAAALAVKTMHKGIVAALIRGDIDEARRLKAISDANRELRGLVDRRTNLILPAIGRTNAALSTANRNLQDGNARQRELKAGIDNARSSLNTGFSRTNANLGVSNSRLSTIAAKDFSPNVNVSVNASTSVSISEVARSATTLSTATSLSSQTRHGFTA